MRAQRTAIAVTGSLLLAACVTFYPEPATPSQPASAPAVEVSDAEDDPQRPALEVLHGRVSYYHDSLAGNHTANGERYRPERLTAASRTLPFGTVVRVVREDTGHSVVVRVNDRGPFGDKRRILDLSRAAAERLDMLRKGVVEVRAEILEVGDNKRVKAR